MYVVFKALTDYAIYLKRFINHFEDNSSLTYVFVLQKCLVIFKAES